MESNLKQAMDNLSFIKKTIEATQKDFSRFAGYFIWIGAINLLMFILEQFGYFMWNINGYDSGAYWAVNVILQIFPLVGYIGVYIYYYRKIRVTGNDVSVGIVKIWGVVLIGSQLIAQLYLRLLPAGNSRALDVMWRCKELIIVLPIFTALLLTGILTKNIPIQLITAIFTVLYFVLFVSFKEMAYGTVGGTGSRISVSGFLIKCIMIIGMILLGLYYKKGVKANGTS